MKLQTKDLMVGDWLQFAGENKKCMVVGVKCDARYLEEEAIITVMDDSGHWFDKELECLHPIPLTPELLEKNGFKKLNEGSFLLEDLEDNYWVKFYPKDTNYTGGVYDYIDLDYGCISITEMPIEFVHELQRVLRFLKVNKDIVL